MVTPPKVTWITETHADNIIFDQTGAQPSHILRKAMAEGIIRSRRTTNKGADVTNLTPDYWKNEDRVMADSNNSRVTIEVHRGDLLQWLGPSGTQTARQPGRPTKWDWEGFWIKAVLLANTPDGLPESQVRFENYMEEWFEEETGGSPAESQIKEKAGKLYRKIRE